MKMNEMFKTNPHKAITRVTINSFMVGSLFFILTLIWTMNPEKFSSWVIIQLVLAIPLLFVSSLAYSKIGYWKETKLWDRFGWFTNNLGNIFVLNVVGLITSTLFQTLSLIYFGLTISLMLIYSIINIYYLPDQFSSKLFKFLFFVVVMILGGILPVLGVY